MQWTRPTESPFAIREVDYISSANEFKIDHGKFTREIEGILRDDYKIGQKIHEDNGGRLNNATNKKFDIERSCKTIRKEGDEDPPEVGLVK
jgi:hypothetical protein